MEGRLTFGDGRRFIFVKIKFIFTENNSEINTRSNRVHHTQLDDSFSIALNIVKRLNKRLLV